MFLSERARSGLGASLLRDRLAKLLKIEPNVEGFRSRSWEQVLDAQGRVARPGAVDLRDARGFDPGFGLGRFNPVVGDDVLPEPPLVALATGHGSEVDLLIGTTTEEASAFIEPLWLDKLLPGFAARWVLGKAIPQPREALAAYGVGHGTRAGAALARLLTDLAFVWPAHQFAAAHKGSTHVYAFDWRSPTAGIGACHGLDLPFVFDNLDAVAGSKGIAGPNPPKDLARRVQNLWVEFASSGALPWPEFGAAGQSLHQLLWSERDIVPDPATPFDAVGNVTGTGGGEIDPGLSALAGSPVTIAPVPTDPAARGSLAAYAAAANRSRAFALGRTATLLPGTDTARGEIVFGAPIGATMSGSVNLSVEHTLDHALAGPAAATLAVPSSNPHSPFGTTVLLDRYLTEAAPLASRNARTTIAAGATLRGAVAGWQWDATLSLNQVDQQATNDQAIDLSAANAAIAVGANSFVPLEAALLTDRLTDSIRQRTRTLDSKAVASNDPFALPAGRATVTVTLEAARTSAVSSLRGTDPFDYRLGRTQGEAGLAVSLPLTSRGRRVLPLLGDISVNASANVRRVEGFGTLADTTLGTA